MEKRKQRPRVGRRRPKGVTLDMQERDDAIILAHSPQTPFLTLEALAALIGEDCTGYFRKRVFALIQEDAPNASDQALLYRPRVQKEKFYDKSFTALTPAGVEYRKQLTPHYEIANAGEHAVHKLLRSMACASVWIEVKKHGWERTSFASIVGHDACPESTKSAKNPLTMHVGRDTLSPDDLWRWNNGKVFKTYFVEADRGTTDVKQYGSKSGSIEGKVPLYDIVFRNQLYTDHFGFTGKPNVLIITSNAQRARSILDFIEKYSSYPERYFVKVQKYITRYDWKVPPLQPELFHEEWWGVNGPMLLTAD